MKTRVSRSFPVAACLTIILIAAPSRAQQKNSPRPDYNPRTVVNHVFPPIVDAPVIRSSEVSDQVRDNELVIGVVVAGEARAYPINMLTGPSREIINDKLGGKPIAATW